MSARSNERFRRGQLKERRRQRREARMTPKRHTECTEEEWSRSEPRRYSACWREADRQTDRELTRWYVSGILD
jgi:hypothetical protein